MLIKSYHICIHVVSMCVFELVFGYNRMAVSLSDRHNNELTTQPVQFATPSIWGFFGIESPIEQLGVQNTCYIGAKSNVLKKVCVANN